MKIFQICQLFLIFIITSCVQQQRTWNYTPNEYKFEKKQIKKTISVLVFEERLKDKGLSKNNTFGFFLPLIPYSTSYISTPGDRVKSMHHNKPKGGCVRQTDGAENMSFNPVISFSYSTYKDIQSSNIFQNANYVCEANDSNSDYIVKGYILDRSLKTKLYSYGLGFINLILPIPHLLGAPVTQNNISLSVKLFLIDKKNQRPIFTKVYSLNKNTGHSGLYYSSSYFQYQDLMQEINKQFINDIKQVMKL